MTTHWTPPGHESPDADPSGGSQLAPTSGSLCVQPLAAVIGPRNSVELFVWLSCSHDLCLSVCKIALSLCVSVYFRIPNLWRSDLKVGSNCLLLIVVLGNSSVLQATNALDHRPLLRCIKSRSHEGNRRERERERRKKSEKKTTQTVRSRIFVRFFISRSIWIELRQQQALDPVRSRCKIQFDESRWIPLSSSSCS